MRNGSFSITLFVIFGVFSLKTYATESSTWTCQPSIWSDAPVVVNSVFQGTIENICELSALNGGSFLDLQSSLMKDFESKADTIHEGPHETTFQELPSVYYELTETDNAQGYSATIRQVVNIATDETSKLIVYRDSKKITGEGQGKFLKSIKQGYVVDAGVTDGVYKVRLHSRVQIQKPPLIPQGLFLNEAKKGVEDEMLERRKRILTQLGQTL